MKPILQLTTIVLIIFSITLLSQTINVPADYTTIQTAIDNATDGNIILVQPGTYNENINFLGKNIVVGSLFLTTNDTSYISQTIIRGTGDTSVVSMQSSEPLGTELVGFSITNGLGTGDWPHVRGGGVHLGKVYPDRSEPTIRYCYIYNNSSVGSSNRGAGIYSEVTKSHIKNCRIFNNSSKTGVGITLGNGTNGTEIDSCEIFNNNGEGITVGYSRAVSISYSFVHNNRGNGIRFHKVGGYLGNCTITENRGKGVSFFSDEDTLQITNTIIYNNESDFDLIGDSLLTVEYSIVQNDTSYWFNETCIVKDPMLDGKTYLPLVNSPVIDAGNPNSPYDPDNTIADIGAFYFNQNAVGVDDNELIITCFLLEQNYPNPFNPSTVIRYDLPQGRAGIGETKFVTLKVFNSLGQEVATLVNQKQNAGSYEVEFNASSLPSGIYFYSITAGENVSVKKMMLLK